MRYIYTFHGLLHPMVGELDGRLDVFEPRRRTTASPDEGYHGFNSSGKSVSATARIFFAMSKEFRPACTTIRR